MSISTHVLDTATGKPVSHLAIVLSRAEDNGWVVLQQTATDQDGRCKTLLPPTEPMAPGIYSIRFDIAGRPTPTAVGGLYPYVEIAFTVLPGEAHYHIPLLLTANSYTTYRGS